MSSEKIISFNKVSFGYGAHRAIDNVSFDIINGDYLAIIGPNGGGKTTLIKLMLGLIRPDAGNIEVLGSVPGRHGGQIGYLPQYTTVSESFPITVRDAVLMGRVSSGLKEWFGTGFGKESSGAVEKALNRVGMLEYIDHRVSSLSGGQKQRVFIARAIVDEPHLLLLDEPAASVDWTGKSGLYCLLKKLNRNMTVVMVSHDISVLGQGVKSVACVNKTVHMHDHPKITRELLSEAYGETDQGECPVELITHGKLPHRVLELHKDLEEPGGGRKND